MMGSSDILGDAQAETGAGYLLVDGRTSIQSIEDPALFLRRDALTLICNCHSDHATTILHLDSNRAAWR